MSAGQLRTGDQAKSRLAWAVQAILLLFTAYTLIFDACYMIVDLRLFDRGMWGGRFGASDSDPSFLTVQSVRPGQALALAGVVAGDRVRFSPPYEAVRVPHPWETATVTVEHAGKKRQAVLRAMPGFRGFVYRQDFFGLQRHWLVTIGELALVSAALVGGFMIWRSRRRPTILMLGAALVTFALDGARPPQQFPAALFPLQMTVDVLILAAYQVLLYGFALGFYRDHVGRLSKATMALFWAYVLVDYSLRGRELYLMFKDGLNPVIYDLVSFLGVAACLGCLVIGWRRSAAEVQQRYALLLVAAGCALLAQVSDTSFAGYTLRGTTADFLSLFVNNVLTWASCGLFAYAIFRHKVFDLGFAVNRTLVYGAVSAILLVAFGLVEWASDHFIPIEGREKNAIVDAVVALGVFLTFHRLRDWVEQVVERLLFHDWHLKEQALRQFVREAAFVQHRGTLVQRSPAAFSRFADGAPSDLYWLGETGLYRRLEGDALAPCEVDADDAALISLRSERTVTQPSSSSSFPAAGLVLPMLHRGGLMGFMVLGAKPSGLDYRPDEKDLLGWAAQQIGLDLSALDTEQLQTETRVLRQELDYLRRRLETIGAAVVQRS
jgi:hypothetical protein